MGDEGEKRKDAGDAVRDGVRSVLGILGALKDAIEESFEDLRGGGEEQQRGESAEEQAAEGVRSTFQAAQDAVEDVRERLDFVTRREFDAQAAELEALKARVDALESQGPAPTAAEPAGAAADATADPTESVGEGVADDSGEGADYRFEVE